VACGALPIVGSLALSDDAVHEGAEAAGMSSTYKPRIPSHRLV